MWWVEALLSAAAGGGSFQAAFLPAQLEPSPLSSNKLLFCRGPGLRFSADPNQLVGRIK